mmetsp:Transcript_73530/g.224885  ORF Transcript_73530/g.224885 Transcript_73530/m.224885 type:complete len:249 (-) Transcript_73530:339-1085(-)
MRPSMSQNNRKPEFGLKTKSIKNSTSAEGSSANRGAELALFNELCCLPVALKVVLRALCLDEGAGAFQISSMTMPSSSASSMSSSSSSATSSMKLVRSRRPVGVGARRALLREARAMAEPRRGPLSLPSSSSASPPSARLGIFLTSGTERAPRTGAPLAPSWPQGLFGLSNHDTRMFLDWATGSFTVTPCRLFFSSRRLSLEPERTENMESRPPSERFDCVDSRPPPERSVMADSRPAPPCGVRDPSE